MTNRFEAEGNLGRVPELRTVIVNGAERDVLDFYIFVERRVPDGNGGFEDRDGFWLNGSLWGGRARPTHKHLKKGTRVHVGGELRSETWEQDGAARTALKLDADYVAIDPMTYARKDQ